MPIPVPTANETEQEFVSRCISEVFNEYGQEQGSAICYSTYRTEKMSKMTTPQKVAFKVKQLKKYEGLNLLPNGEVNMIEPNPCWEGWEAIGTKMLDGREVPNCVPIKE
jgi:hypothetical protein